MAKLHYNSKKLNTILLTHLLAQLICCNFKSLNKLDFPNLHHISMVIISCHRWCSHGKFKLPLWAGQKGLVCYKRRTIIELSLQKAIKGLRTNYPTTDLPHTQELARLPRAHTQMHYFLYTLAHTHRHSYSPLTKHGAGIYFSAHG